MDGAIILAGDASRIARANVHLVPNPNVPTSETGTRHRTAERVARSIDVPVISVSEDMGRHHRLRRRPMKHVLEEIPRLLNRANQALQTLERYKIRLDDGSAALSTLEVEDLVTRARRRRRAPAGRDGAAHRRGDRDLHHRARRRRPADPAPARRAAGRPRGRPLAGDPGLPARHRHAGRRRARRAGQHRHRRPARPPRRRSACCGCPVDVDLESNLQPRGYRLLAKVPRLPEGVIDHVVDRFGSLQKIMRATLHDLEDVQGVGEVRARAIKDGLSKLAETQHPRPLLVDPARRASIGPCGSRCLRARRRRSAQPTAELQRARSSRRSRCRIL